MFIKHSNRHLYNDIIYQRYLVYSEYLEKLDNNTLPVNINSNGEEYNHQNFKNYTYYNNVPDIKNANLISSKLKYNSLEQLLVDDYTHLHATAIDIDCNAYLYGSAYYEFINGHKPDYPMHHLLVYVPNYDYIKAAKFYTQMVNRANFCGYHDLGILYYTLLGNLKNCENAISIFEPGAAKLIESKTPNHYHYYSDSIRTSDSYFRFLFDLYLADIIQKGYFGASKNKHQASLLRIRPETTFTSIQNPTNKIDSFLAFNVF